MGVTPARDPKPGNTDSGVIKTENNNNKSKKGKVIRLVLTGKEAGPQECVGSQTRDRAKQRPRCMKKIADPMIFKQSTGKSVSYADATRVGMEKHAKSRSLLNLTSK
jgi:co-chaperonin GroES (HSP10)